jgi:regulator of sigma E protease
MIAFIAGGIFLLAVCIVIHELGHMWMGRLVGVKAEIFSFGYGRGIWQKKIGDTTYQITAIPLGGYVKFYGDDLQDPESKRPGGFFSVPPLVRIIPVLGGPLFNLILGFLIFLGLSAFSGQPPAKVQLLEELGTQSPAFEAGLVNGDRILSIDGRPIKSFQDIQKTVMLSGGKDLTVVYEREGKRKETILKPDLDSAGRGSAGLRVPGERYIEVDFPFSDALMARIMKLFGLPVNPDPSLRALSYLDDGDVILSVQGERVSDPLSLQELLGRYHGREVEIRVRRQSLPWLAPWFTEEKTVIVPTRGEYRFELKDIFDVKYGQRVGDFTLVSQQPEHQRFLGDLIVDGEPAGSFEYLYERFREQRHVTILIGRGDQQKRYGASVLARKTGLIGFRPGTVIQAEYDAASASFTEIINSAFQSTIDNIMIYPEFFHRLVSGRISFIENTMGPVGMFAVAGVVIKSDLRDYFHLMASISIALMVMNLLPFPVVDGGHIVFFLIEAILRRPLSPAVLEGFYRFGFLTLVAFGLFVMYRDLLFVVKM